MKNCLRAAILISGSFLTLLSLGGCTPVTTNQLWAPSMPDSVIQSGPIIKPDLLEQAIHLYTNRARSLNGQKDLIWSEEIAKVARSHSVDMAENAYFGHINLKGESATERARRLGYSNIQRNNQYVVSGLGENIFATHRYKQYIINTDSENHDSYQVEWKDTDSIAQEAVEAWLKSTPHRRNLLSPVYKAEGVGVSIGTNGTIFITQNFN